MASILRVKRKKDEEPLDALLISCKRSKVENEAAAAEEPLTAIVKFAGTVEKADDSAVQRITKSLGKDYLEANYKQRIVDVANKVREKTKRESSENRYKVVNSKRSVDAALVDPLEEEVINIIDIEDTKASSDDAGTDGYMYDLYYTQLDEGLKEHEFLSVLPICQEELVFEDHYRDENERDGETSDSNSESNWRNEYPDSDEYDNEDEDSVNEKLMRALNKMGVDEDDLSSDDEDFVYGLDERDVEEYGYKYAKYKARIKKEEEGSSDDDDCSEKNSDSHSDYGGDDED